MVLRDSRCSFTFRASPGVLEIRIEGLDKGQLGSAPLDEIARGLVRDRPLELFVDATRASMPSVDVSRAWTRFFALNQKDLKRVSVLVGSKSVELTIAIAQHLSQTGKLIQIYSDEEIYEARKAQATKRQP
ncbi:MAG TPA: hypothetical protein VM122_01770 [Usitatibacter sp.]|nr:hypothetical protein [Usitatibacter sp.]